MLNASLTEWGITDNKTPSRGLWYKSELHNTNILQVKAIIRHTRMLK